MKIKSKISEDRAKHLLIKKAREGLLSTKVRKSGNSHYVLIPIPVLDAIGLKGKTLSILLEPKRMVLVE